MRFYCWVISCGKPQEICYKLPQVLLSLYVTFIWTERRKDIIGETSHVHLRKFKFLYSLIELYMSTSSTEHLTAHTIWRHERFHSFLVKKAQEIVAAKNSQLFGIKPLYVMQFYMRERKFTVHQVTSCHRRSIFNLFTQAWCTTFRSLILDQVRTVEYHLLLFDDPLLKCSYLASKLLRAPKAYMRPIDYYDALSCYLRWSQPAFIPQQKQSRTDIENWSSVYKNEKEWRYFSLERQIQVGRGVPNAAVQVHTLLVRREFPLGWMNPDKLFTTKWSSVRLVAYDGYFNDIHKDIGTTCNPPYFFQLGF